MSASGTSLNGSATLNGSDVSATYKQLETYLQTELLPEVDHCLNEVTALRRQASARIGEARADYYERRVRMLESVGAGAPPKMELKKGNKVHKLSDICRDTMTREEVKSAARELAVKAADLKMAKNLAKHGK